MAKYKVLTEDAERKLQAALDRINKSPVNPVNRPRTEDEVNQAPDVLICWASEEVDPRVDIYPGYATLGVYRSSSGEGLPILTRTGYTQLVLNMSTDPIPAESWVEAKRDRFGDYYAGMVYPNDEDSCARSVVLTETKLLCEASPGTGTGTIDEASFLNQYNRTVTISMSSPGCLSRTQGEWTFSTTVSCCDPSCQDTTESDPVFNIPDHSPNFPYFVDGTSCYGEGTLVSTLGNSDVDVDWNSDLSLDLPIPTVLDGDDILVYMIVDPFDDSLSTTVDGTTVYPVVRLDDQDGNRAWPSDGQEYELLTSGTTQIYYWTSHVNGTDWLLETTTGLKLRISLYSNPAGKSVNVRVRGYAMTFRDNTVPVYPNGTGAGSSTSGTTSPLVVDSDAPVNSDHYLYMNFWANCGPELTPVTEAYDSVILNHSDGWNTVLFTCREVISGSPTYPHDPDPTATCAESSPWVAEPLWYAYDIP